MNCAECGAPIAEAAHACAECGAPANDARPWPAEERRRLLACLIFFLILFAIGQVGVFDTAQSSGPHAAMVGVSFGGVIGALFFLVLFEYARKQFAGEQGAWAFSVLASFGLLASLPFLWLALARRRMRDWVVFAVYLAATITVITALSSVPSNTGITGIPAVTLSLLLVVGSVHAVLAYSRAANLPTWREVYSRWAPGDRRAHLDDPVIPADRGPEA